MTIKFTDKKLLALVLSLMMIMCMVPVMSLTANATDATDTLTANSTKNTSGKVTVGTSIPDPTAYIVTFAGNGKTNDVAVESFPRTITADWLNENGELDKIIKELYNFSGYCREAVPTSSDTDKVTGAISSKKDQYITINNAFDGTVTVDFLYYNDKTDTDVTYTVQISVTDAYTITWKNDDGTTIDTTYAAVGAVPTHADPVKKEDDNYTYTFSGWTPEIVAAEGDAEYTAAFNSTDKKVAAVVAMFNALPDPENVTVDDKDAIEAAGYALAALTNAQKALIAPADIARYRAIAKAFAVVDQAAADKAAAEGVTYLINQIPAEVTENDKEAVENARKAYEMLTDAQKALLSADTLAKLEAAEKVLFPKLVNDSEIVTIAPTVGEKISVKGAASGGAGGYTYAFYYKKSSKTDWHKMAEPFTTNRAAFKPSMAVKYDVKVVVKDADGKTEEKIFTFKAKSPLVNNSELLTTEPKVGEKIRIKGAASGGSGSYTYAFYYKKTSRSTWYKMAEPYTTKTAAFKPTSAISYDIKVVVNDTEGRTAEQIYTVDVAK